MAHNMKKCSKCLLFKGTSEFGKHNQTKDGLKSRCKLCHAAESRASRNTHIDRARAYDRDRPNKAERARESRLRSKAHRIKTHATRLAVERAYREANGAKIRVRLNKWKADNPGKVNADTAKRRAAKLKATPKLANAALIRAIYVEASRLGKEVDHIIPLRSPTVCGLHLESNLQLLTPSQNACKGNSYGA